MAMELSWAFERVRVRLRVYVSMFRCCAAEIENFQHYTDHGYLDLISINSINQFLLETKESEKSKELKNQAELRMVKWYKYH